MIKWRVVVPNLVTLAASGCALCALLTAFYWQTRTAALWLLAAGICDAVDGPIARRLQGQSKFGKVYDSMSDFLAFGLAPSLSLVYLDLLHPVIASLYILAIQFRLTRYMVQPEEDGGFFQGVSAPDAVYLGVLVSLVPYADMNWGFGLMSLLAIYPGRLMPKGYRVIKVLVAAGSMVAFIYLDTCAAIS